MSGTHFSLRLDALSLSLGGLSDGPTAPELEADPAVGVAHDDHGEEVGEDHKAHVVPGSCRSKRGESSGAAVLLKVSQSLTGDSSRIVKVWKWWGSISLALICTKPIDMHLLHIMLQLLYS